MSKLFDSTRHYDTETPRELPQTSQLTLPRRQTRGPLEHH